MPPNRPISFRLPALLVAALDLARGEQTRSRSSQIVHYLVRCLTAEGYVQPAALPAEQQVRPGVEGTSC